jgi:hypothetical protein
LKEKRWAFIASLVCGIFYFLVYALDPGKIFPDSPNEMPAALLVIEIVGTIVSIPLTYLSLRAIQIPIILSLAYDAGGNVMNKEHFLILALMVLAGIGIIIFATLAAIGK